MKEELIITSHAYLRMKERNGWNKKSSSRMVEKVYTYGLRPEQVKGYLKGWVRQKQNQGTVGYEYVLYGEKLYVFNDMKMITVMHTPSRASLLMNCA